MERFLFRKQLQLLKCCSPVGIDNSRWRLFWFELVSGFFLLHLCRWRGSGLMTIFCLKLAVFSKPLPTFEERGNESTKIQFWWYISLFPLPTNGKSAPQYRTRKIIISVADKVVDISNSTIGNKSKTSSIGWVSFSIGMIKYLQLGNKTSYGPPLPCLHPIIGFRLQS